MCKYYLSLLNKRILIFLLLKISFLFDSAKFDKLALVNHCQETEITLYDTVNEPNGSAWQRHRKSWKHTCYHHANDIKKKSDLKYYIAAPTKLSLNT